METRWHIELFGGLTARKENRFLTRFRTQKTGALLAYLAYHLPQRSPREALIELLWPLEDPQKSSQSLRTALSALRRQLEPPGIPAGAVLLADRFTVGLNPKTVTTDVAEFQAALERAEQAKSHTRRIRSLRAAVDVYRGELLAGFNEEWIPPEQRRWREQFFQALTRLIGALERFGNREEAMELARRGVSLDPLREEMHREVMRLLEEMGQPLLALRQYRELAQVLKQQMGLSPGRETLLLAREIERRRVAGPQEAEVRPGVEIPSDLPAAPSGPSLPEGTVTFLLTDIEGSTKLGEQAGAAYWSALEAHHRLLREVFGRFGGYEVKEMGDGFIVAFQRAGDALQGAIACQRALAGQAWPEAVGATGRSSLRVRMALYTGDVEVKEGEYRGLVLHRASRVLSAGHGGQVLCAEGTARLVQRDLASGVQLMELGVYRLRDVATPERLFQVEYPEMPEKEFPPLKAEAGYRSHLPLQFTRFFGRKEEIERLEEWLAVRGERLVTLSGPGGSGKTRLALEVAKRLVQVFEGAVWFVPLADLSDPRLIGDAVVGALGIPRSPQMEPLEQVVALLSQQPSLLVLDNFEHLIYHRDTEDTEKNKDYLRASVVQPEGAQMVRMLLEKVPNLTCLITSRQRLDLDGEREFAVSPLPTPKGEEPVEAVAGYPSIQFFVDRAQGVAADFQVTAGNAASLTAICCKLEGVPLALELAAAKVKAVGLSQMLHQLERRLDFLVRRSRDRGAERHQSLRAAIDWSYRLLAPEVQWFFCQLSVFRGGWDLEAAERVCEEPSALEHLSELVGHSLVLTEETDLGMRYRMLEMIREYGREQLASKERVALGRRHARYYMDLAEEAEPQLRGPEQKAWLHRLEMEHDNLRAALAWSLDRETETGGRLACALCWFWNVRGYLMEGRRWLEQALSKGQGVQAELKAKALSGAGILAYRQGDYKSACVCYEESLALFRQIENKAGIAMSLHNLGLVAHEQRNYALAQSLIQKSLTIYREINDRWGLARSLSNLGNVMLDQEHHDLACSLFEESLMIQRELGDSRGISMSLHGLGLMAWSQGNYGSAGSLLQESLAMKRELGDKGGIALSLYYLGNVNLDQGNYDLARLYYGESLTLFRQMEDKAAVVLLLEGFARLAAAQGHSVRAVRLIGAEDALSTGIGVSLLPKRQLQHDRCLAALRNALSESAFTAAFTAGQTLTWEEAVAYALE